MTYRLKNGTEVEPVATFNNGYSHIIVDDHCYVIVNGEPDQLGISAWIFPEALRMLATLPLKPDEATPIRRHCGLPTD